MKLEKLLPIIAVGVIGYFLIKQFGSSFFSGGGGGGGLPDLSLIFPPIAPAPSQAGMDYNTILAVGETAYGGRYVSGVERRYQESRGKNVLQIAPSITQQTGITHVTAEQGKTYTTRTGGGELDKWIGGR